MRQLVHFPAEDGRTVCGLEDPHSFTAFDHVVTCPQCKRYDKEAGDAGRREDTGPVR